MSARPGFGSWTCHWTPVCAPGTPEAPTAETAGRAGATRRANVPMGRIATSAGGCAGAGPESGFSGWKRTSAAVTSAIPETRNDTGFTPVLGVSEIVSPGWA